MDQPLPTVEERYAAIAETMLQKPQVTLGLPGKKGFGASALCVNGKIFAMLSRGKFIVKLPRKRVDVLVAANCGEHYDPGSGRLMKEWLAVTSSSELDWLSLAQEALTFAVSTAK